MVGYDNIRSYASTNGHDYSPIVTASFSTDGGVTRGESYSTKVIIEAVINGTQDYKWS